jgi:asparagine synthase (glutamine-hydrolysing)
MCGIFAYLNDIIEEGQIDYNAGSKRGPETTTFKKIDNKVYFAFHRLAINGLNDESNQPIEYKHLTLICNGEIYNYKQLSKSYNLKTQSDCEVILHLYEQFGTNAFHLLDGEFSFILYDSLKKEVVVVRDPYGVRPLYENNTSKGYIFSSVLESMMLDSYTITQVKPGTYSLYRHNGSTFEKYCTHHYYNIRDTYQLKYSLEEYRKQSYNLFENAVLKRIMNSERPICGLLSGGLDSSLVCAIAARYYKSKNQSFHTFSIGMEKSEDVHYASIVAKHIGSVHHEVLYSQHEFIQSIPNVIKDIESYDTTTVRASVGNWLIGKYIKENTDFKVVLNGDGADELMGGYLYFNHCNTTDEFQEECFRLLEHIHYFDVLRSDRSISSHGLEPRTPYLDKDFTKFYLSIPVQFRKTLTEKEFFRKTIQTYEPELLPSCVLWREKEAFSDGVSSSSNSWYKIIQEQMKDYKSTYPLTQEQSYYLDTYQSFYPNCQHLIPYYWMPSFVYCYDPSARTLHNRNIVYEYFYSLKHFLSGICMNIGRKYFS